MMSVAKSGLVDANPVNANLKCLLHIKLDFGYVQALVDKYLKPWPVYDLPQVQKMSSQDELENIIITLWCVKAHCWRQRLDPLFGKTFDRFGRVRKIGPKRNAICLQSVAEFIPDPMLKPT